MTTEFEENLRNEVENEAKEKDPPTNDRELEKGIQDLQIYKGNTIDDFRFEDHDPDSDNNDIHPLEFFGIQKSRDESLFLTAGNQRKHFLVETMKFIRSTVPDKTNSDFDGDDTIQMEVQFDRVSEISKSAREKINRSKSNNSSFENPSNTRFSEEHSIPRETMETEFEKNLENEPNEDVSPPDTKIEKEVEDLREFAKICNSVTKNMEQFLASLGKLIEYKEHLGSSIPICLLSDTNFNINFGVLCDTTRKIGIASDMANVLIKSKEDIKDMSDKEKHEYFLRGQK